jgi:O-antigen ligase
MWPAIFAGAFGAVLGMALLKFGNPVILDRMIERPAGFWELVLQPWPLMWGYVLLTVCFLLGVAALATGGIGLPRAPWWVLILPLPWLFWQLLASVTTVDSRLTQVTLIHFVACATCYYLGLAVLARVERREFFWIPMLVAMGSVLWMGIEQRYGGLAATREVFFQQPDWQRYPAEYIRRIESDRIFSTLVYPNALAGALLLLTPCMLLKVWQLSSRFTPVVRGVLAGLFAYASFACLYWSGSKAGWLIALAVGSVVLLSLPMPRGIKAGIVAVILLGGLTGFFVKFAPYFSRGAPSVGARLEYWRAASTIAMENPVFGSGPGTFSVPFSRIKPPDAEMARLVHNDFLEQASDSGIAGALAYFVFIWGSVIGLVNARNRPELFAVWLGVLGWSMHSFVEFPLYIPALSWTAFAFLGWLWGEASMESTSVKREATLAGA